MVPIPERLEHAVGESHGEDVLHVLLAEEVVDAEDLLLVEARVQELVESLGAGLVVPEWFLDDHARTVVVEPGALEGLHERTEGERRHR